MPISSELASDRTAAEHAAGSGRREPDQRGLAQKCNDRETIPLCAFHHRNLKTRGAATYRRCDFCDRYHVFSIFEPLDVIQEAEFRLKILSESGTIGSDQWEFRQRQARLNH